METATLDAPQSVFVPKSYLSEAQREKVLREHRDDLEEVYIAESDAAAARGDMDSAWGWMAKVRLPHYSLMRLKRNHGAEVYSKVWISDCRGRLGLWPRVAGQGGTDMSTASLSVLDWQLVKEEKLGNL